MIENLLKQMRFLTEPAVDYDPHQFISNRRKNVKRKTFKHVEVVGLADAANWDDYPKENPKDTNVQEDSSSSVKDVTLLMPDIFKVIVVAEKITPLASHSERTNKREFSGTMDIVEEDTAMTPKRQKIESEGQMVQTKTKDKGK